MDCWDCEDGRLACLDDRYPKELPCTFIAPGSTGDQAMEYLAEFYEPYEY
ncbi:hypothetical protein GCM10010278_57400 [Streptomyces melanogenes]|nr:hypothetical protein GCM10010278_57400 [Streptomyces melanogenes]